MYQLDVLAEEVHPSSKKDATKAGGAAHAWTLSYFV